MRREVEYNIYIYCQYLQDGSNNVPDSQPRELRIIDTNSHLDLNASDEQREEIQEILPLLENLIEKLRKSI